MKKIYLIKVSYTTYSGRIGGGYEDVEEDHGFFTNEEDAKKYVEEFNLKESKVRRHRKWAGYEEIYNLRQ